MLWYFVFLMRDCLCSVSLGLWYIFVIISSGFLFLFLVLAKKWGDGGGGHCLVRMEWCPAGWLVCLPLLIFLAS